MPYPLSFSSESLPDVFQALLRPIRSQMEDGVAGMDLDITEADHEYVLKAEIPGVSKEDLTVEVDGNTVTIRANKEQNKEVKDEGRVIRQERFWGQLERTVALGSPIDESKTRATYENGLLTLTLPKTEGHENKKILIE
ncbi:MAG: Hsp20/alpha crystallin family protein [Castellaniella sp.]|nr:Hsp20/alpha crystallin family protein [Castellaniella sp.]